MGVVNNGSGKKCGENVIESFYSNSFSMSAVRSRTLKQFSDEDRYDDFNGSGGGALPDDSVGVAVDWLAATSAKPYVSFEENSDHAHYVESSAVVVPENITVSTPA